MEEKSIQPGYTAAATDDACVYDTIAAAVVAHNEAAQPGEAYWGVSLENSTYTVYEYGEVPQPPTAEELAEQAAQAEAARKRQEALDKLPETLAALTAAQTDTDSLMVDQEYRLTLLELGIGGE